jgi:hypothetical protein
MPDLTLNEEPLQFGEGGRLLGILTLPSNAIQESLPVFVFLSAGLLHRVGPHRLHVRLARELGRLGFRSLRVDLAGRGDSPERIGLKNQAAAAADFAEILGVLDSRLGKVPLVLAGLCAGADNAIRLSLSEPRVVGMLLLDPVCEKDAGFARRALVVKYTNPARYVTWLKNRWKDLNNPRPELTEGVDSISLRDIPTPTQMRTAFESIRERKGRVISLFTQYALSHYNQEGQLARVLGVDGYGEFCTEEFWPHADHTFTTELHRRELIRRISEWAAGFRSA